MKFHFGGKYSTDEDLKAKREHLPLAVPFKEPGKNVFALLPHELLHALCFKEDVYLYYNPSRLLLFVHGVESMTRARFVFLSLLPNIIFGFIPFVIFMIEPSLIRLGTMGIMSIGMGFGDYINVFNALTQMPKGAMTYLSGFHSYWYKEG